MNIWAFEARQVYDDGTSRASVTLAGVEVWATAWPYLSSYDLSLKQVMEDFATHLRERLNDERYACIFLTPPCPHDNEAEAAR